MNIEVIHGADAACDEFVASFPLTSLCMLSGWGEMVQQAFGHPLHYIVARQDGQLAGVLPLCEVRSRLFGKRMISQAFGAYGGPLVRDAAALRPMVEKAIDLCRLRKCDYVEFRTARAMDVEGLTLWTDKITMHLPLLDDPDAMWKNFDAKVRNQVRKAEKSNIVPRDGGVELLDEFYDLYVRRMHQLGTPCYSRKLMEGMFARFPQNTRIFVVEMEGKPLGAGITTCFAGLVEIHLAATLVEYNNLCPNNLLYWAVIKYYSQAGAKVFDFGTTVLDSGPYKFKKQWGPQQVDLQRQFWVRPGYNLVMNNMHDDRYAKKVEMWKRLPLWATKFLGPMISRNLP